MFRFFQITMALSLGIALAGCNRSQVQPVPAPSVPTSHPVDQVPPPQGTNARVVRTATTLISRSNVRACLVIAKSRSIAMPLAT